MDILDDVWEIDYGFISDDMEDREALLGYNPSLESRLLVTLLLSLVNTSLERYFSLW